MKKIKISRLNAITNIALVLIIAIVFIVGFYGEKSESVTVFGSEPLYYGDTESRNVSLMFNVYENSEVVDDILELLARNSVKATFFVGGCWADDNEELLKKIIANGCEIGNHGYFHKSHDKLNAEKNREEIENTEKVVFALTGVKTNLFAPPSGAYSKTTLKVAFELGYRTVMWSKDSIDWRDSDEELIFSRVTKNLSGGELILMHPKAHTYKVLQRVLDYFEANNLKQVTVTECLS